MAIANLKISWIVWYAIGLHASWAIVPSVLGYVPRTTTLVWFPEAAPWAAAVIFGTVATLAMSAMLKTWSGLVRLTMLLPQQAVLMLSADSAIRAVVYGTFADGVARHPLFILVDQAPAMLAALAHSLAVLEVAWRR